MRYALAPMNWWLAAFTWALFAIPIAMFVAALAAPSPASPLLFGVCAFFVLTYASVWFWWRPSWFEIVGRDLIVRWPLRTRTIHLDGLRAIDILPSAEFRRAYGYGMRIGAGGLWGGFGLLKTRNETFAMYISRTDRFVVLRPSSGRALMITPEDPERFVGEVRRVAG